MTRITKIPDERRSELVATAQQLFYLKGYERTSVSDIVKAVGVAQGTFYYYFDTKQAILEAVVNLLIAQALPLIQAIVADRTLDAIPKWNQLIQVVNNWKIEQKDELLAISRTLRMDENLRLHHQLRAETIRLIVSECSPIIVQGIEEGVFDVEYPLEAIEYAFNILSIASDGFVDIVLNPDDYENPINLAQSKFKAAQAAVERILGAPSGSLRLADEYTITAWFVD